MGYNYTNRTTTEGFSSIYQISSKYIQSKDDNFPAWTRKRKTKKTINFLYGYIKRKLSSITGPGQGLLTSWDACSSWISRKMDDISPFWFGSVFLVCFTNSKARRYTIRKTLNLVEIKLINSKGYSNSIYVIFNISNLSLAKHRFFLSPLCGWMT